MECKIGFIGTGNMGGALAMSVAKRNGGANILLADFFKDKAEALAKNIGALVSDNEEIAKKCSYIFLGVKPQMMQDMLLGIRDIISQRSDDVVLISMAAGLSTDKIASMAGGDIPVVRIMPNTPVSVGKGVVLVCSGKGVTEEQLGFVADMLGESGYVDIIDEKLIDAASAVSGCGPAFVYMFAESLADGAVASGLPRAKALAYAAKMIEGSAKLLFESGAHPGELKDNVCSPGGSTIEGVKSLENGGFRGDVIDAVRAAYKKTVELGK